jgi:hypothetical protein
MKVRRRTSLAQELRRGVIAAVAGTGAMTLSSSLEMKMRGREPSMVPADAAAKLLRIRPGSERFRKWLGTAAHIASGLALGLVRPAIGAAGVREPAGAREIAISGAHHVVFTAGASLAYGRSGTSSG